MTAVEHPLTPEDLMAFRDGELPIDQAAVVRAHLSGCEACRELSGDLRGVSRHLARWQVDDPPVTLAAPRLPHGTEHRARWAIGWLLRPSVAYGLAGLSIVGLLIVGTQNRMSSRPAMAAYSRVTPSDLQQELHESDRLGAFGGRLEESQQRTLANSGQTTTGVPPVAEAPSSQTATPPGSSIARTARLRLRVTNVEAGRGAVERILQSFGGWFRQVDASGGADEPQQLRAALMVPSSRLDDAMTALKALGRVIDESRKAEDVTDQVVDVEARLSNARNTENRLVELLRRRTGNLADVLAAEREIARVREEIERFDAQRKSLERRVVYATVLLELSEDARPSVTLGPRPPWSVLRDEFTTGVGQAIYSGLSLVYFAARVAPVLLLWSAILGWPVLMLLRWRRRRMAE
jgi:hypothetical protein